MRTDRIRSIGPNRYEKRSAIIIPKDVTTLMSDVQRIVMEKFGVKLEPEVKFLGEF